MEDDFFAFPVEQPGVYHAGRECQLVGFALIDDAQARFSVEVQDCGYFFEVWIVSLEGALDFPFVVDVVQQEFSMFRPPEKVTSSCS